MIVGWRLCHKWHR
jgi:hypothetical protein